MADNPKISKAEIDELRSLIKLLEKEIDDIEFENLVKSGKAAKELLMALRKEASGFTQDITDSVSAFQGMVNQLKNTQTGVNKAAKGFQALTSIAEKLQYHQKGIIKLNEKDVENLSKKLQTEKQNFSNTDALLKAEQKGLENQKRSQEGILNTINSQLDTLRRKAVWTRDDYTTNWRLQRLQYQQQKELSKINSQLELNLNTQGDIAGIISEQDTYYLQTQATIATINSQLEKQRELLGLGGAIVGSLGAALDSLGLGGLSKVLGIQEADEEMKSMSENIVKEKQKEIELEKEIEEANARGLSASQLRYGFGGKLLKQKQLELDKLKEANAEYEGMGGKIKVLKAGLSSIGKSLKQNLTDPVAIATFLVKQFFDALKSADKLTGELAKGFNMSYAEASRTRQELGEIANLSMDSAVNTARLQESMMAIGKSLGSNAQASKEDLITFTKLREQAGFTNDELAEIQKISLVNGKTLKTNTKEVLGSAKAHASMKGLMINEKDILREVGKASAAIKVSLGGSTDALAKAAVQAKSVGLNLEQADKIAGSLLNFEDSINSELEAELLTGKNLNLERARLAAINNDIGTVAEEIAKQVGSTAEFNKMNRLQQEAIAKAVGMERNELAQSLMDREALAKLSGVEGKTAQERFNNLVKEVGMEEAKKRLGDEELAKQFEQQSVQERFNQSIEKLKEIFISIADPVLQIVSPLANLVSTILPAINALLTPIFSLFQGISGVVTGNFEGLSKTQVVLGTIVASLTGAYLVYKGISAIMAFNNALKEKDMALSARAFLARKKEAIMDRGVAAIKIISGAWSSLGPIPFVGAALAAAAIAGGIAYLYSQSKDANDMVSSPGYGKRTLFGPEGAIRLNDKDTVIAGTDLFKGNDVMSSPNEPTKSFPENTIKTPIVQTINTNNITSPQDESVKPLSENTIKAPVAQTTDMSKVEALLRDLIAVSKNPTPAPAPVVKLDNTVLTNKITERQRVEASGIQ